MSNTLISFAADEVVAETAQYTAEFAVHTIVFTTGDPESEGHCWNFSRAFHDDWGVCTVREIQRATMYEGIASFRLHRSGLECVFDSEGATKVGVSLLHITFEIDDQSWQQLAVTARIVFQDRAYFNWEE